MQTVQKQTAETTLKLFQNNTKQGGQNSSFQFKGALISDPPIIKVRKLLPKEQYACDIATD